jgi:hypothetical protein
VQAAGGPSYVSPVPWYLPGRHQLDRGPSEFNHTQRLVTSFVWQLPGSAKQSPLVRYTAGGWQLTGLFWAQSGAPLTVIAGKDQSGTATNQDRANYVAGVDPYGGNACGSKAPCVNYINAAAFVLPPQGWWGNVGKGALRGTNNINVDATLAKDIPLHKERVKLQFRAEFFNLLNRVNFFNPGQSASNINGTSVVQNGPNVSGTGFGQITADGGPRIGQLALKRMRERNYVLDRGDGCGYRLLAAQAVGVSPASC